MGKRQKIVVVRELYKKNNYYLVLSQKTKMPGSGYVRDELNHIFENDFIDIESAPIKQNFF